MKLHYLASALALVASVAACEKKPDTVASTVVTMHQIDSSGEQMEIGTITLADTPDGLKLTPDLSHLTPGTHGFHVHENGSCDPGTKDGATVAGLAAGGHLDPDHTGHHEGPTGTGHMGDLPALEVGVDGTATTAVVAPRLKIADVWGHALMIHQGGDNYADSPAPLGGGGARVACGIAPTAD